MSAATERTTLRGGRGTTETWDTADAVEVYEDLLPRIGDPVAASIVTAAVLLGEAVREARS